MKPNDDRGETSRRSGGRVRETIRLDGTWDIEESVSGERPPRDYTHRVPVPGLVHLSDPPFEDVDEFLGREFLSNPHRTKDDIAAAAGNENKSRRKRTFFWYRRKLTISGRRETALLRIGKAQFGTAVWVNGRKVGERHACFSASTFDITDAVNWAGENEIVVRIGADPDVVPQHVPTGTDFEKRRWTPGIYDRVAVYLSDNPLIRSVQVAPRLKTAEVVVQTELWNASNRDVTFDLIQSISPRPEGETVASAEESSIELHAQETKTITQIISIPNVRVWEPEDPFLYVLHSSTGGDEAKTTFGMRELSFDTATKRAYLNGKMLFLRGSNITLHRFFEDPLSGSLPWNDDWVRRLLVDIPRKMNWNAFRFCIGPVPDRWLEIADEAGLIIQYEFFLWTGPKGFRKEWAAEELVQQYADWMRDSWNHPSVGIWDASNETVADVLRAEVVPRVRKLDLSNRPWDNGYNLPDNPNDPVEDHPYLYNLVTQGKELPNLEESSYFRQPHSPHPTAHAKILNEYGWLWLNRDGTPTILTEPVWEKLLGKAATNEQRLETWAYLLAQLTEFWRAHREYAAVLHFVYLAASYRGAFTSDNFRDVQQLRLDPYFEDYVREAFKPLGVYINLWRTTLKRGIQRLAVSLVNDYPHTVSGSLSIQVESTTAGPNGVVRFEVPPNGQHTYLLDIDTADVDGDRLLIARAQPDSSSGHEPTICRRRVKVLP